MGDRSERVEAFDFREEPFEVRGRDSDRKQV